MNIGKIDDQPRVIHLFAGGGGGFFADFLLGHRPVCAVEIEPDCRAIMEARRRDGLLPADMEVHADVRDFDGRPRSRAEPVDPPSVSKGAQAQGAHRGPGQWVGAGLRGGGLAGADGRVKKSFDFVAPSVDRVNERSYSDLTNGNEHSRTEPKMNYKIPATGQRFQSLKLSKSQGIPADTYDDAFRAAVALIAASGMDIEIVESRNSLSQCEDCIMCDAHQHVRWDCEAESWIAIPLTEREIAKYAKRAADPVAWANLLASIA